MGEASGRRKAARWQARQVAFGRQVRGERERAGLTQVQLAARLGASQAAVAQIERGQASPSLELAEALASVLQTTVDALLGGPRGARVVHYHVPGEVQVTVSNPGLVVFGKLAREEIDAWLAAWQQMRQASPEGVEPHPRRNRPPGSAGNC